MSGINLLGHEENGSEKKREGAGGFELTNPQAKKLKSPVTSEGAATYVHELLDAHRPPAKPQRIEAKRIPSPSPSVAPSVSPPPPPPPLPPRELKRAQLFHHDSAKNPPNGNGPWNGGIDVNLIPEHDDDDFSRLKRVRWLVVALLGSLLAVGIAYAALLFYESRLIRETNSLDEQLTLQQAQIRSFAADRLSASAISRRVAAVSKLLDQHPRLTNVFEIVEDYTLPTVYYSTLSATTDGSITLTAFAPDYAGVADQLRVFENAADVFTSVRIQQATNTDVNREVTYEDGTVETLTVPKVTFGVELTVDPKRLVERRP